MDAASSAPSSWRSWVCSFGMRSFSAAPRTCRSPSPPRFPPQHCLTATIPRLQMLLRPQPQDQQLLELLAFGDEVASIPNGFPGARKDFIEHLGDEQRFEPLTARFRRPADRVPSRVVEVVDAVVVASLALGIAPGGQPAGLNVRRELVDKTAQSTRRQRGREIAA